MGIFSSKAKASGEKQDSRNVDTVIGPGAVFEGNLRTRNSVCVEGTVKGHVLCEGRVILNKSGVLEADVVAEYISVNGTVLGNVKASKQLDVGETGVIRGDVDAASITIARGGVLKGSCSMAAESGEKANSAVHKAAPPSPDKRRTLGGRGNGLPPKDLENSEAKKPEGTPLQ
jgi:cytoskeletal protein CcmA (bactofilin family)